MTPEVTAADRAAAEEWLRVSRGTGPERMESLAAMLATVRAEGEAAHVEHHPCLRCYEAGRRAATRV